MRILFFIRHDGYLRTFESALEQLASRGHHVHIAFGQRLAGPEGRPAAELLESLQRRFPRIVSSAAPPLEDVAWDRFGTLVRASLDYLRYLEPEFRDAPKLRARARRNASLTVVRVASLVHRVPGALAALRAILKTIETVVPVREVDTAFIRRADPDLVVVTPLLDGGPQPGYLRASHALGIRAGYSVSSWDNLTSKGLIHGDPRFVTLWNDRMAREAELLHGVERSRIHVTGAQVFDHWFVATPTTTRAAFCAGIGLDPGEPLILYMCSSGFIAGRGEPDFIDKWIAALREDPRLRRVGILVRPHPANLESWSRRQLADSEQTAVWRAEGSVPIAAEAKAAFFDSIWHSAAVVGINTSALIESAIVGRPVFTVTVPEFADTQRGTPHFELIASESGVLTVASSFAEHREQLQKALSGAAPAASGRRERFLESFVRPGGIDVRATDRLVEVLEEQAAIRVEPSVDPLWARTLRIALAPLARVRWRTARRSRVPHVMKALRRGRKHVRRGFRIGFRRGRAPFVRLLRALRALRSSLRDDDGLGGRLSEAGARRSTMETSPSVRDRLWNARRSRVHRRIRRPPS